MFESLFGNKNIERVLLFLFVNGSCFGMQLRQALNIPLTPIQKALQRLEKGGVILSTLQGKTRIYRFHPAFPLLSELESLIKKVYSLLPAKEKQLYYAFHDRSLFTQERALSVLLEFWKKLSQVTQLTFHAKSQSEPDTGWNGRGTGSVSVKKEEDTLLFEEKGRWHGKKDEDLAFRNIFRWTLDRRSGLISLEHLRRGPNHPVFLFHLEPSGNNSLSSVDSHLCNEDSYFGQVHFDRHNFKLNWRVIGPKKNEEIDYYYY